MHIAPGTIASYGPFVCGDGKVVFLGVRNERERVRFCKQIPVAPQLATDPRFASNSSRGTLSVAPAALD